MKCRPKEPLDFIVYDGSAESREAAKALFGDNFRYDSERAFLCLGGDCWIEPLVGYFLVHGEGRFTAADFAAQFDIVEEGK